MSSRRQGRRRWRCCRGGRNQPSEDSKGGRGPPSCFPLQECTRSQHFQVESVLPGGGPVPTMSIDAATSDSGQERRLALYRRWQVVQMELARFSLRRPSALFDHRVLLLAQFLLLSPLTAVDAPLWSISDGPFQLSFLFEVSGKTMLLVLIPSVLVNGNLFHRVLSHKTVEEQLFKPRIRLLRFLFGGLPILGLYVVPIWQQVASHPPSWALVHTSRNPSLDLATAPTRERRWRNRLGFKSFAAIYAVNTIVFIVFHSQWCATLAAETNGKWLLAIQSLVLHLIAFACIAYFLRKMAARFGLSPLRSAILLSLSLLWLLPVPYLSITGMLLVPFVCRESERDGTLTEDALSRQRTTGNLPEWRSLEENLRRNRNRLFWWQRWRKVLRSTKRAVAAERARSHFITICDIKSFVLLSDVAVLSWLLSVSTRSSPPRAFMVQALLGMILLGSFALGLISFSLAAARLARRLLGSLPGPGSFSGLSSARNLGIVSISLFVGIVQGQFWIRLKLPQATLPENGLISLCLSFYLLTLPGHLLSKAWALKRPLSDHLLRLAFLITLLITGGGVHAAALGGDPRLVVLFWAISFLLCSVLPSAALLPWLLRPFKARPVLSSNLPVSLRTALAFLIVTAVAPFGGLAVPAWIWLRQRLWSNFEREPLEKHA
jgi:hypothetical protein